MKQAALNADLKSMQGLWSVHVVKGFGAELPIRPRGWVVPKDAKIAGEVLTLSYTSPPITGPVPAENVIGTRTWQYRLIPGKEKGQVELIQLQEPEKGKALNGSFQLGRDTLWLNCSSFSLILKRVGGVQKK